MVGEDKFKVNKIVSFILWGIAVVCCFAFFMPVQEFIITIAESYIGRLLSHEVWRYKLTVLNSIFVSSLVLSGILLYFVKIPFFKKTQSSVLDVSSGVSLLTGKKFLAAFVLLYFLLVGVRCFWISQKKSFHIDEPLSISIANRNEYGFWGKNYEQKEYTGKELKIISLWDDSSFVDALKDIYHLHNNNRDSPHTNFYYTCLRLAFIGVKTGDIHYIFWRGCLLNVLFFSISYFFMYVLLTKLTKNKISILCCLFIAFCNPAAISLSLFLRPYELQQTLLIIFALLFLCSFDRIKADVPFETKTNFFMGSFIVALTMLSGYFSIFLIGFFGFIIVSFACFKKRCNTVIYYIGMFISSLIFAKLLYFGFGEGVLEYRGQEALSNIQTGLFVNFSQTMKHLLVIFHKNNFFLFLILSCFIVALFVLIIKNIASKRLSNILLLTFAAVFSYIVTLFFAPIDMKLLRYVAPLLPLCSVLFIADTKRKYETAVLFAVCCLSVLSILPISMNSDSFEHIDDSNIDSILSVKEPDIPVVIKGDTTLWQLASFIPYIPDDQICYIGETDILGIDSNLFWYCIQEGSIADHYNDCCTLIQKNDIANYLTEYLFQKN
mgnify:CR=1 FL=1